MCSAIQHPGDRHHGGWRAGENDAPTALTALSGAKQSSAEELAVDLQRDALQVQRTLEALLESGPLEGHGNSPTHAQLYAGLAPVLFAARRPGGLHPACGPQQLAV